MKQRLLIALLTAIGFAAGFGARMMTEAGPSVPPPPAPGAEFVRSSRPETAAENKERKSPMYSESDRKKFRDQIEEMRPKIESYRKRIEEISSEFETEFQTILTTDQKEKFVARAKRDAERRVQGEKKTAETTVLSDEQIFQLQQRPLWNVLWNVAINGRLERLIKDYKLEETQQQKVRQMLLARRDKFLALVDSVPPPSITYSELAVQAEKLSAKSNK